MAIIANKGHGHGWQAGLWANSGISGDCPRRPRAADPISCPQHRAGTQKSRGEGALPSPNSAQVPEGDTCIPKQGTATQAASA